MVDKIIELDYEAKNRNDVLNHLAKKLVAIGAVKDTYPEAIVAREKNFPTGLNTESIGVAMPHTDANYVLHEHIAILRLKNPVTFLQMGDGEPVRVKLIFMLALMKPHEQLEVLQKLVTFIQDTTKVTQLLQLKDIDDVLTIINKSGL